ncbi:MAG: DUF441 domain-containing protein [bacterium]
MPQEQVPLLFIFFLGMLTRNNILSSASGILLVMQVMNMHRLFPVLENRAIDLGLLFLTMAILVPFTTGKIKLQHILYFMCSPAGLVTIMGGIAGAVLNARGVNLLRMEPDIIGGIIFGSLIGILFCGGIPVGPVMAAGLSSVLLQLYRHFL